MNNDYIAASEELHAKNNCNICRNAENCIYKSDYEESYNKLYTLLSGLKIAPITNIKHECRFYKGV